MYVFHNPVCICGAASNRNTKWRDHWKLSGGLWKPPLQGNVTHLQDPLKCKIFAYEFLIQLKVDCNHILPDSSLWSNNWRRLIRAKPCPVLQKCTKTEESIENYCLTQALPGSGKGYVSIVLGSSIKNKLATISTIWCTSSFRGNCLQARKCPSS